jgi:hypothetical protein
VGCPSDTAPGHGPGIEVVTKVVSEHGYMKTS